MTCDEPVRPTGSGRPIPLGYAARPAGTGRAAEALARVFTAACVIGLLGGGSVAWALLVRHR